MNILVILQKLRDDIKTWTTNNLKYLNDKIEANKSASVNKDTELETRIDSLEEELDTHEHTLSKINTGYQQAVDPEGNPVVDENGNPVMETVTLERILTNIQTTANNNKTELENKINSNTSNIQANANAISANKTELDAEDDRLEGLINTNSTNIQTNADDIDALDTRVTQIEADLPKIVILSQEEYDILENTNAIDNDTFYLIKD